MKNAIEEKEMVQLREKEMETVKTRPTV